ncbi:Ribophorin I-domain-containing protein [Gaertneriomyces semiglobifer]|nr:Ribophorin I-domain-containing protein [Gaertneriomyces semiglobifer]
MSILAKGRLFSSGYGILGLLCVLINCVFVGAVAQDSFTIDNIDRTLDLSAPSIVREYTSLVIKGNRDKPSTDFLLAFPAEVNQKISAVFVEGKPSDNAPAKFLPVTADGSQENKEATFFNVELPQALRGDETYHLRVRTVYTHWIRPYPKEIAQNDHQKLELRGNAYFFSPYKTKTQKTTVRLPNTDVINFSSASGKVSRSGNLIQFGPYGSVGSFAEEELYVHYADERPIVVVKKLERKLEISHWGGNLAVEENYEVHHEGAKLKGHFSRVDYSFSPWLNPKTNAVRDISISLPPNVKNVYYRDTIGNVSTSDFFEESNRSVLRIRPRYPLYGGWRYTWHHGYDVPIGLFLHKNVQTGQYEFMNPFVGGLSNVTIDSVKVTVVLPEGASVKQIVPPFAMDSIDEFTTFSYLDTTGRPTIVFEKHNLADEHAVPIKITYSYPSYRLLQKPLTMVAALLSLFLCASFWTRSDFSIRGDPTLRMRNHHVTVEQVIAAETKLIKKLKNTFDDLKSQTRLSEYGPLTAELESRVVSGWTELMNIINETKATSPSFAETVHVVHDYMKERLSKLRTMHNQVVQIHKAGKDVDSNKRKEVTNLVARLENEVKVLEEKIHEGVEALKRKIY